MFIVVNSLSNSIEKELKSRGIAFGSKPTYGIGLAYAILSVSIPVFNYIFPVMDYVLIAIIAGVVCFISYWSNVSGYKNKLESLNISQ